MDCPWGLLEIMDISVIMVVRNEEKQIRECLETVSWVDEIVIIDQSSTDSTVKIAKEFTDKIFITTDKGYCEPDRNFAIEKASGTWIFYIDADERVSPELKNEILSIVKQDNGTVPKMDCPKIIQAYYVKRRNYFLGRWIKTCGWYPSFVLRLFKKNEVKFPSEIHQVPLHKEEYGYLKNDILHYSYNSISEYFEKFNRYTTQIAKDEFKKGIRAKGFSFIIELILRPIYNFFLKFIWLQGFRDDLRGFFISVSSSLTLFVSKVKLWEIWQKQKR